MDRRIKIGVDVDGGDDSSKSASERIYEGVVAFKNDYPEVDVVLCGTQDNIKKFDESLGSDKGLRFSRAFSKEDSLKRPAKDTSLNMLAKLAKNGEIDGIYSIGDTARIAIELLRVGRLNGTSKPTLLAHIPGLYGDFIASDVGANGLSSGSSYDKSFLEVVNIQAREVFSQTVMSSVYATHVLGRKPRVGLLSNGTERHKGSNLVCAVDELFEQRVSVGVLDRLLDYVGKVEPVDCFRRGKVDLMISDGYSGNLFIKTAETVMRGAEDVIRSEFGKLSCISRLSLVLGGRALRIVKERISEKFNPDIYGAALLLGYNGIIVKGHGNSNGSAVYHGLSLLARAVDGASRGESLNDKISEALEKYCPRA